MEKIKGGTFLRNTGLAFQWIKNRNVKEGITKN